MLNLKRMDENQKKVFYLKFQITSYSLNRFKFIPLNTKLVNEAIVNPVNSSFCLIEDQEKFGFTSHCEVLKWPMNMIPFRTCTWTCRWNGQNRILLSSGDWTDGFLLWLTIYSLFRRCAISNGKFGMFGIDSSNDCRHYEHGFIVCNIGLPCYLHVHTSISI